MCLYSHIMVNCIVFGDEKQASVNLYFSISIVYDGYGERLLAVGIVRLS